MTKSGSSKEPKGQSPHYRNPPAEFRFKKGQSGNPRGRPKKSRAGAGLLQGGGIFDQIEALALAEAHRPISVREGKKVTAMPAIQALLRSMFHNAAQGDARTQRQLLEYISRSEWSRAAGAKEILQGAVRHKNEAEAEEVIAEHLRSGREPPDIYPHPDDVIIDEMTGNVEIDGPLSKEQAGAQFAAEQIACDALREYFAIQAELEKDPGNRELKKRRKQFEWAPQYLKKVGARRIRLAALTRSREAADERAKATRQSPKERKRRT